MKKDNNIIIEYLAFALLFIILVFTGMAIFFTPENKMEYRFKKLEISDDFNKKEDEVNIADDNITLDNINNEIKMPQNTYNQYASEYAKEQKRKKINAILNSRNKIKKHPVMAVTKSKNYFTGIGEQTQRFTSSERNSFMPERKINENPLQTEEFSPIFSPGDSTCSEGEMEYILVLYDKALNKQFVLPFRRTNYIQNAKPEIISITLPRNKWKDAGANFSATLSMFYDSFFSSQDSKYPDKTKVSAGISTPCSSSFYVSGSFYTVLNTPVSYSFANSNYCNSQGGRLPDILELISLIKDNSSLPFGNYLSSSEIISNGKITNQKLILNYFENNMSFSSSSNGQQKLYYQCVFD